MDQLGSLVFIRETDRSHTLPFALWVSPLSRLGIMEGSSVIGCESYPPVAELAFCRQLTSKHGARL